MTDDSDFVRSAIDHAVERSKAEILRDIADGTITAMPTNLRDLDHYVDTQCLGGMCDDWLYDGDAWPDTDSVIDATSRVQDAVNDWILGGGLKGVPHDCADADSDTVNGVNSTCSICGLAVSEPTDKG